MYFVTHKYSSKQVKCNRQVHVFFLWTVRFNLQILPINQKSFGYLAMPGENDQSAVLKNLALSLADGAH